MKKKFNIGDLVKIKYTGEVKRVMGIVKAAYYCYYLENVDGYYIDTDLEKV